MNLKEEFIKFYEALNPELQVTLLFAMRILETWTKQEGDTKDSVKSILENK